MTGIRPSSPHTRSSKLALQRPKNGGLSSRPVGLIAAAAASAAGDRIVDDQADPTERSRCPAEALARLGNCCLDHPDRSLMKFGRVTYAVTTASTTIGSMTRATSSQGME